MARYLAGCAILLTLGACSAAPAASSPPTPPATTASRCGPANAHTLAASASARVYVVNGTVYGCANGTGRHYRLGNAAVCINATRVGPVAVTGTRAAYGAAKCGVDTGSAQVIVRRLTDGRQLVHDQATALPLGPESYESVGAIVLGANSAVAWIGIGSSIVSHRRDVEVHKHDRTGEKLLDTGTGVLPGSLRLHGSMLTWTHGASTHSTSLR